MCPHDGELKTHASVYDESDSIKSQNVPSL